MKTVTLLAHDRPITQSEPEWLATASVPRKRYPVFTLGMLFLLGVPFAIIQTVVLAYMAYHH